MKRLRPLPTSRLYSTPHRSLPIGLPSLNGLHSLHTSPSQAAQTLPLTATGPPPSPPLPAASQHGERVDRRRRQASLVQSAQDLKASTHKPGSAMKKRFWRDVHVTRDADNNHTLQLDTRPVKNPTTKTSLLIPPTKSHLATALALEWDTLTSAQQALRPHLIPLTSLASRAHTLALEDAETARRGQDVLGGQGTGIRYEIVNMMLRYLDTDTILCWAPATETELPPELVPAGGINADIPSSSPQSPSSQNLQQRPPGQSLRDLQIRVATPILAYLTTQLWPGVELNPVLDEGSILPKSQPPATRAVVKGWMAGLPAWELVGLERAVLAGKSLCVGARLVGEWGENIGIRGSDGGIAGLKTKTKGKGEEEEEEQQMGHRFGIEEAAEACSLEVRWQTGKWGEVEDSHDVDKEDLKRQFGSVVLLVSGTGASEDEP